MKHIYDIRSLLEKFVQGNCTPAEAARIAEYFKENNITEDFPTVEQVRSMLYEWPEMEEGAANRVFENVMAAASAQSARKRRAPIRRIVAIAASFALLCSIGWYYLTDGPEMQLPEPDGTEITLQLENGDIQVINADGQRVITDKEGKVIANQQANTIVYDALSEDELVYNTLTIPYGKRFEVQLSDGTHVHLNSGTTLRYPVKFIKGQQRTVYLDGEGYFDVAKDAAHPFIVNASELNVQVLGTHFNVSAYPEDHATDVVLVEGSVGLYKDSETFNRESSTLLVPGERGSFVKRSGTISKSEVTTQIYTAWIKGELVFRNMSFKNICRKLERHYNVKIENTDDALASQKFNASFKDEPVENVLGYFKELNGFTYTKQNNTITIKPAGR